MTVFADVNVRFVRHTEQIVIIAHYFLIGADEQHRQIIRLARFQLMQFENRFALLPNRNGRAEFAVTLEIFAEQLRETLVIHGRA